MAARVNVDHFQYATGQEQKVARFYFRYIPRATRSRYSAFLETTFLNSHFGHRGGAYDRQDVRSVSQEHLWLAKDNTAAFVARRDAFLEGKVRSRTSLQAERVAVNRWLTALRAYLTVLHLQWAARLLV